MLPNHWSLNRKQSRAAAVVDKLWCKVALSTQLSKVSIIL